MSHPLTPIQKQRSHLAANGRSTRLRPSCPRGWHPAGSSARSGEGSPGGSSQKDLSFPVLCTRDAAFAVGASGKAVGERQVPEWAPVRCRSAPSLVSLNLQKRQASCQHASGSGTIPHPHVAKARLGDLGPGRGGIRPLALTQKPLSHSAGSRASNHTGRIFSGAPCPLAGTPCRYVSEPLTVPGEK